MATWEKELAEPPADARGRELWLQHGIGLIVFEDVRGYALERIDPSLGEEARQAAVKAIDDAVYGLMMVIDGVTGGLRGGGRILSLQALARLERLDTDEIEADFPLADGDGMCMGFHGWLEGDFGEDPVVLPA